MKALNVGPAYGRVYESPRTMQHAWNDGKDFKTDYGSYVSVRDVKKLSMDGYTEVVIWCGNHSVTIKLEVQS